MRKKLVVIGILLLAFIVTVFIKFYGTTTSNNNVSLDGLSINLDSSWDYENADIFPPIETEDIKILNGKKILKNAGNDSNDKEVSLQIEHYVLASGTFKEYLDNNIMTYSLEEDIVFDEAFKIDNYEARKILIKTDSFVQYMVVVGKNNYFFTLVYNMFPENYELNMDEIETSITTIKISSVR
ncbi:hypothetical protein [Candidatus Merdisoma sp. JLR.KK006]|jgi:hypothetical protein|uniref:hypothetical protein n=1 Tax=Candidatus Merdisoma sp. JLR.KK006 TaxID=3112626 RepID=UPI002FEF3446